MYATKINIKKIGRAFAVDLSSTNPPLPTRGSMRKPFMPLLWSIFTYPNPDEILQRLQTLGSQKGTITFSLKQLTTRKSRIKGELYDFFQEVKKEFPRLISDREPYVNLSSPCVLMSQTKT